MRGDAARCSGRRSVRDGFRLVADTRGRGLRPAHIGHRRCNFAACTACRRRSSTPTWVLPRSFCLRGNRARRQDLRRARRRKDPAYRRRAAAAPEHRAADRDAREARRRPHADDQRRAPREEGAEPGQRGSRPRDGEPRFARRRDVSRDERRRLSPWRRSSRASTPQPPRDSLRSRATWS